jgi:hypothetical protein
MGRNRDIELIHNFVYYNDQSDYAIRLASTIANTTISERGFSALKRLQTRLRSCLTLDRLDKLIFIAMNAELVESDSYRATNKKRKRMDDLVGLTAVEEQEQTELMTAAPGDLLTAFEDILQAPGILEEGDSELESPSPAALPRYLPLAELCI